MAFMYMIGIHMGKSKKIGHIYCHDVHAHHTLLNFPGFSNFVFSCLWFWCSASLRLSLGVHLSRGIHALIHCRCSRGRCRVRRSLVCCRYCLWFSFCGLRLRICFRYWLEFLCMLLGFCGVCILAFLLCAADTFFSVVLF